MPACLSISLLSCGQILATIDVVHFRTHSCDHSQTGKMQVSLSTFCALENACVDPFRQSGLILFVAFH